MTEELLSRLEKLEMLHSEQAFTILSLNDTVAEQDREISRLKHQLKQIEAQLQSLRSELSGASNTGFEPPPHY